MTLAEVASGTVLWNPAPDARETSRLGRYLDAVEKRIGRRLDDYQSAWQWSVDDPSAFWESVWDHCGIRTHTPYTAVLGSTTMPGAQWFPGATINYAEHALARRGSEVRLKARSQTRAPADLTGDDLAGLVGRIQQGLRDRGIGPGDRVVGYLPNIPEAVALYLAAAGLGAIWCSVPAEMGPRSVIDRVGQLDPSIIVCVDGYVWGSKTITVRDRIAPIVDELGAALTVVQIPYLDPDSAPETGVAAWSDFIATASPVSVEPVPFDHPLVVLFSSGTTGLPKAIVHSHGGILLEHMKALVLQMDFGPGSVGFWYTTTGWMVWNILVSGLVAGGCIVLFDGDPGWPDLGTQWGIAAQTQATLFGTSAGYLAGCARAGLNPGADHDLSSLEQVTSSGSALSANTAAWIYAAVDDSVLVASTSGGTDVCSGFVGGSPLTPVYAGEMSCRPLGVATESFDESGKPVVGVPGELVVTAPMPSMPVAFWGDEDGSRYRATYFDTYPGIWRHGDWLVHTERDTWVITGRSDATLNRGGVRLGTAEFYSVLDGLSEVVDSLVVHLEDPSTAHGSLVVVVATSSDPTSIIGDVKTALRQQLSPRHAPDRVIVVKHLSRNKNGKRLEIPVKRILQGVDMESVVDLGSLVDAEHFVSSVETIRAALASDHA